MVPLAIPDSESVHDQFKVTLVLFQPLPFAAGDRLVKEIPGAVLSMLMPVCVFEVVRPALFVQVPVTD